LGAGKGLVRKGVDYDLLARLGLTVGLGRCRQKELARGKVRMHRGYVQPTGGLVSDGWPLEE
jgi:hypothetical protein